MVGFICHDYRVFISEKKDETTESVFVLDHLGFSQPGCRRAITCSAAILHFCYFLTISFRPMPQQLPASDRSFQNLHVSMAVGVRSI